MSAGPLHLIETSNSGCLEKKGKTMSKGHHRSAISGRYISSAAAARHPRTSVTESSGRNASSGTHHRSAISGRYISPAAAARHPNTSMTEKG